MRAGLNPMLRFRTFPEELAGLDLGDPFRSGDNWIYLHKGVEVTGVTKLFSGGDHRFRYAGNAMTYYYFHGSVENKSRDVADVVVSLWGNYRCCEQHISRDNRHCRRFRKKYPNFSQAIINGMLARTKRGLSMIVDIVPAGGAKI